MEAEEKMEATNNYLLQDTPASGSCYNEKVPDCSKREAIINEVQQLVDDINTKRKTEMFISQYKNSLEKHIEKRCRIMNQQLLKMLENHSRVMEEKLNKLAYYLDRAAKAESELMEFKQSLATLFRDMQQDMQEIARY